MLHAARRRIVVRFSASASCTGSTPVAANGPPLRRPKPAAQLQPPTAIEKFTKTREQRAVKGSHGRIETRTLTTSSGLAETSDWAGAQQVFKLERQTEIVVRHQQRAEVVYGITSLSATEASPAQLLAIVRQHWGQENGLHYRRDVTFHEDAGRTRDWTVAEALAILNNLVLALLLRGGQTNAAQERRYYAAHPDLALKRLLTAPA